MKHPIVLALAVIGVVFVGMVISVIAFVLLAKPFENVPWNSSSTIAQPQGSESSVSSDHPLLTPAQETMLQNIGINPATLPTSITQAQKDCAIAALGESRVLELLAGAQPSLSDVYKAKGCL